MSFDVIIEGLPLDMREVDVARTLALWCGEGVATVETEPGLHVALAGIAGVGHEWLRGPRGIEVFSPDPGVMWLTLRHADDYTFAVARGFGVWLARQHQGRAVSSATGEVYE